MNVLIVEDDEAALRLLVKVAEGRNHHVVSCRTGEEAWDAYQAGDYALVLIDWLLPGMDGLELCRRIRAHERGETSVLFVITIRDKPDDLQAVLDAGADDYLAKPVDLGTLRVRLAVAENRAAQRAEKKEAERARKHLRAQLLHAQKLEGLSVMAGGIAHDFNNLLMTILGNVSLGLMDLPEDAPLRENLDAIQTATLQAADLTNQLLAYAGRGKYRTEPVYPGQLASEMESLLLSIIGKRAELRLHAAPGCPPVQADVSRMRQVIINLVTNASEACQDGHGRIEIRVEPADDPFPVTPDSHLAGTLPEPPRVALTVRDNGTGIAHDDLTRVFDPFFTTKFTGRGLGLASVMGIVRAHHGAVYLASAPGQGAQFTIVLPAAVAHATPPNTAPMTPALSQGAKTILVVDDEAAVRQVTKRVLERFGYTVQVAADGFEAIEHFRAANPPIDAVLLDLTMPGLDGAQVFEVLRTIDPDVRVLLASGYAEESVMRDFDLGQIGGFIHKPYTPAQLRDALTRLIGLPRPGDVERA